MRWEIDPHKSAIENLFDACRVATLAMRKKHAGKVRLSADEWNELCNEVIAASVQQFLDSKVRRHTYCHDVSFYVNCASCVLSVFQFKLKYFLQDVRKGIDNVDRLAPEARMELIDTACPVNYLSTGSGSSYAAMENLDAWMRKSEHGNFLKREYSDNYWEYLEACESTGIDVNKNALDYLLGCQYATGAKEKVQMILIREETIEGAVMGKLFVGGVMICSTLENEKTLIPTGTYKLNVSKSPKFERMLPLVYNDNVPMIRGIRIHAGNSAKDSSGCILVGERIGNKLINSRPMERKVTEIARNDATLEITQR